MTETLMPSPKPIRTFDLAANVNGWLDGTIDDWPANIQDVLYAALERKAKEVQLPIVIVYSKCEIDPDVPEGSPGHFYLHVIASEIVIADERALQPGTVQKALAQEIEQVMRDLGFRH